MNQASGTIYGLFDPITNELRYVGQTVRTLQDRLLGHLGDAINGKRPVHGWIRELRAAGKLKPKIAALVEGVPKGELLAVETATIQKEIEAGNNLLNKRQRGGPKLPQNRTANTQINIRMSEAQRALLERATAALVKSIRGGRVPLGPWLLELGLAQARELLAEDAAGLTDSSSQQELPQGQLRIGNASVC